MDIYQQRLAKFIEEVTIYPVSGERFAAGRSDLEWLEEVLAGGARIVQLRDKESSGRKLLEKAQAFRRATRRAGALFIVNDRLDIALLSGADGLHLGNDDLPAGTVRSFAPDLLIGVSCHNEEEVSTAELRGASYYNIGPIFATATKKEARTPLGPEAIPRLAALSKLPFTVMGGIKQEHLPLLKSLGVRRPAVVTALTAAPDIQRETAAWIAALSLT